MGFFTPKRKKMEKKKKKKSSIVQAARYWVQGYAEGYHLWIFAGRLQDTDGEGIVRDKRLRKRQLKSDWYFWIFIHQRGVCIRRNEHERKLRPAYSMFFSNQVPGIVYICGKWVIRRHPILVPVLRG